MLLLAGLAWAASAVGAEPTVQRREPPAGEAIVLRASGKLDPRLVPECSALWPSPTQPGVFWTLSDSGAKPRITPVRADGSRVVGPGGYWDGPMLRGAREAALETLWGTNRCRCPDDVMHPT